MKVHNIEFAVDLNDILIELKSQLTQNRIDLLDDIKDGPKNVQVTCIYHANGHEHKPSAGIKKDTGVYHCFACDETHDFPEFISNCFGKNDMGAFGWSWLLKNFLTVEVENRNVSFNFSRSNDSSLHTGNKEYVSEDELDRYRYYHPYWKERGIIDEDIIELFDLGYDINSNSITFPVRDIEGHCLFVARRSVKTKFFNYPEGVKKPLYGLYELSRLDKFPNEIYICESMLDALTIWQYNKYAVALNGLGNELSIAQIRKLPCRKVILATDKDEAGKKARIRLRKELNNKIVTELDYRTYPDHAKDMNDMTEEEFYALGEVF